MQPEMYFACPRFGGSGAWPFYAPAGQGGRLPLPIRSLGRSRLAHFARAFVGWDRAIRRIAPSYLHNGLTQKNVPPRAGMPRPIQPGAVATAFVATFVEPSKAADSPFPSARWGARG